MHIGTSLLRFFVAALAVVAFTAGNADGQTVPVAEAQSFLGAWTLTIEGTPLQINITDDEGEVAAEVEVMGTKSPVTTIARAEDALTLRYMADMGGQQAPISIRLTPAGEDLATVIDVADGMFTAQGTATKS